MCAQFLQPQLASRAASLKESIWIRIGDLQTLMNDRDRSLDAFERVLQVNPGNIHAMTQIGLVLAKKERYPQALNYLQRAVAADSTCGEAWSVLAHCYFMTDDLPKSYHAYQNALNYSPDPSPNLWYGIGQLYERYGSADHALETFQAVLRMAPNFERAIEVCFYIGTIYKEQRKFDLAIEYFEKISLAPNPPPPLTRADAWHHIGHVNELKADIPKALEMYKLALNENPNHAKTLQNLGWLEHFHKNNSQEAIRRLRMSLEADQNDAQAWYLLGRVCMDLGEVQQAFDAYQQAILRDGHNANFWCAIGVLYYQQNQYRDAMDAYMKSIALNPSVAETWDDLATLYESQGQIQHAIEAYRKAAELSPEKTHIQERLNALQNSINNPQQQHQHQQPLPMPPQPGQHPRSLPPSQPALPPVSGHSQPLRRLPNPQAQLQPLQPQPGHPGALRPPGSHGLQQQSAAPIPMLTQPPSITTQQAAHQALPRHMLPHPLQQPPTAMAQGSTGFNHQTHPLQPPVNHLRSSALPHLAVPRNSGSRPNSQTHALPTHPVQPAQSVAPLSGATHRPPGPSGSIQLSRPSINGNNSNNDPLLQPLPHLPALRTPRVDADMKAREADNNNNNQTPQLPFPTLKKIPGHPGKEGTLERIPSLHRPSNHPIPSLAPLIQNNNNSKQVGNTENNNTSNHTPLKTSPLPPLQRIGDHGGSTLPPVATALENNNSNSDGNGRGTDVEKREGAQVANGIISENGNNNTNTNEDAKLLQSMALSGSNHNNNKPRSLLNEVPTSSPPIPALPIPRSGTAPALLGASSLTSFGRPGSSTGNGINSSNNSNNNANNNNNIIPNTLPSPLAQPRAHGIMQASPKKIIVQHGNNAAALPRLSSLPVLIGIRNGINNNNENKINTLPSPPGSAGSVIIRTPDIHKRKGDGNDKRIMDENDNNGNSKADMSNSSLSNSKGGLGRKKIVPRSVPISSITGGDNEGNNNKREEEENNKEQDDNNNTTRGKREGSPGAAEYGDKSYKRPRVGDGARNRNSINNMEDNNNGDGVVSKNSSSNSNNNSANGSNNNIISRKEEDSNGRYSGGSRGLGVLAIPSNAPLPSFRSSRMKMGNTKSTTTSPLYAIPKSKPMNKGEEGNNSNKGDAKTKNILASGSTTDYNNRDADNNSTGSANNNNS